MKVSLVIFLLIKGSKKGRDTVNANPTVILSKNEVNTIRENMLKGKQADAILIKESELRRIKNSTKITTKKEEAEKRRALEEQREREQEASELLKTKMKSFDQTRAKKLPLSEYQREQLAKNQALLENAQKVVDEEMDDVKDMNKMIHYAKCVTIRDRQIAEAKELEKQRKEEDLRMDTLMEIERLKVLKLNEQREKEKKVIQHQGALVIIDQIKEREKERQKQMKLKEEEQQEMLKEIKAQQEEEIKLQEQKILKGQQLMETVKEANRNAIAIKQKKAQEEKELDNQIMEYNKKKAEREEAYQAELKRIHDEKEMETQKLRERQLKAMNKQSDIDELKAKRAFEENARLNREKERKEWEERVSSLYNT